MSLNMNYQSLDVKLTGSTTSVPDNDIAKLMYYLDCVFAVIQIDIDGVERYTNYSEYYSLTIEEQNKVLSLVSLFNPKIMVESYLFLVGPRFVPADASNQFYELTDNRIGIHVNSEVIIGGVSRRVLKVMGCTESWLNRNYFIPVDNYNRKIQSPAPAPNYQNSSSNSSNNDECCEPIGPCLDVLYYLTCWCYLCCLCDAHFSKKCKRIIGVSIIAFNLLILIMNLLLR